MNSSLWMSSRRTPPGVRELKQRLSQIVWVVIARRTPPGVRELKRHVGPGQHTALASHPSRGA